MRALANRIGATTAPAKDALPLLKLGVFSGPRSNATLQAITGIEIDYDGGEVGVDAAVRRLTEAGIAAIVVTTPSHHPNRPRWRVWAPLSLARPAAERLGFARRVDRALGGIAASESFVSSQIFYVGAVAGAPDRRIELVEGRAVDLLPELDPPADLVDAAASTLAIGKPRGSALGQEADFLRVASALAALPNGGPAGWEAWNRTGMAIYGATGGSEAGRELWASWSALNACNDPAATDERWTHFAVSPPDSLGAGTLFRVAREHGWSERRSAAADDFEVIDTPPDDGMLNPAELGEDDPPPRRWIARDWLPAGNVALHYAAGGEGKSLLAMQLATSCATGRPWLGIEVERCRVLAWMLEDDQDELRRRQAAINRHLGVTMADLSDVRWLAADSNDGDNCLVRFERDGTPVWAAAFQRLRRQALAFRPGLIVLDTVADIFGGDENSRREVSAFMKSGLGVLARETGAAILVNAHPSRAGLSSGDLDGGSTAWSGAARTRWGLATPRGDGADPAVRVLSRMKSNYSQRGEELRLRMVGGVLVREGWEAPSGCGGEGDGSGFERPTADAVFLALLDASNAAGLHLSPSPNAANYAPRIFSRNAARAGFGKADFAGALARLFTAGLVKNEAYGKPSHGTRHLIRVTAATEFEAVSNASAEVFEATESRPVVGETVGDGHSPTPDFAGETVRRQCSETVGDGSRQSLHLLGRRSGDGRGVVSPHTPRRPQAAAPERGKGQKLVNQNDESPGDEFSVIPGDLAAAGFTPESWAAVWGTTGTEVRS